MKITNIKCSDFCVTHLKREVMSCAGDFDYYDDDRLVFLTKQVHSLTKDWRTKDTLSYREWIEQKDRFPTVKVEGLEENSLITSAFHTVQFNGYHVKDIHAFISNRTGYSFGWHRDTVRVVLFVLSGYKLVNIKNKMHRINPGEAVLIPKMDMHRVLSKAGTVALSIGLE